MERVGIYVRISDDRDGNQTATQRQQEDCRRFAEGKGWRVADVFEDVDLSAYKRNVKRPEFERMLGAVRSHEIDGVLAWKIDRITRRQRDFVRLDEQCVEVGGFIATVIDGIDTRTPTGRFVAELLVAQARMESENASIRIARAHAERARRGDITRGGERPFGYSADRKHIVPEEAELIREAADRVLAGETVRSIAWDWERRAIKTSAGYPWRYGRLQYVLTNPLISGQREHEGNLYSGKWPAIVSVETGARLRTTLARKQRPARPPRKALLGGGFGRCGRCGGPLANSPRPDGARRYVCHKDPGTGSCGRLARLAGPVEECVAQMLFIALDGADLSAHMRRREDIGEDDLVAAIRADEEALEQLSRDHYVDRLIARTEYFAAREGVQKRLEANRMRLARKAGQEVLHQVVGAGEEVARRWPSASIDWKRAVLMAVMERVEIMPVGKGSRVFRPESIVPVWKF